MRHPKQRWQPTEKLKGGRQDLSVPEKLLWSRLKPSISFQFNIKRKHLIADKYSVDFFIPDLMLALDIEGGPSDSLGESEAAMRSQDLEQLGISVIILPLEWVMKNPNEVSDFILDVCRGDRGVHELIDFLG